MFSLIKVAAYITSPFNTFFYIFEPVGTKYQQAFVPHSGMGKAFPHPVFKAGHVKIGQIIIRNSVANLKEILIEKKNPPFHCISLSYRDPWNLRRSSTSGIENEKKLIIAVLERFNKATV